MEANGHEEQPREDLVGEALAICDLPHSEEAPRVDLDTLPDVERPGCDAAPPGRREIDESPGYGWLWPVHAELDRVVALDATYNPTPESAQRFRRRKAGARAFEAVAVVQELDALGKGGLAERAVVGDLRLVRGSDVSD